VAVVRTFPAIVLGLPTWPSCGHFQEILSSIESGVESKAWLSSLDGPLLLLWPSPRLLTTVVLASRTVELDDATLFCFPSSLKKSPMVG